MLTLTVEMSLVTPPVGLNLFAVSGASKIPVSEVVKGAGRMLAREVDVDPSKRVMLYLNWPA